MQDKETLLKKIPEHKEGYWGPTDRGKGSLLFICSWVVATISQNLSGRWTNDFVSLQQHQICLYFISWIYCEGKSIGEFWVIWFVVNDDDPLQTKRIYVGFAAQSEIKRLLQTRQVIITSLFEMWYLLLQYIMFVFNFPLHLRWSLVSTCITFYQLFIKLS